MSYNALAPCLQLSQHKIQSTSSLYRKDRNCFSSPKTTDCYNRKKKNLRFGGGIRIPVFLVQTGFHEKSKKRSNGVHCTIHITTITTVIHTV